MSVDMKVKAIYDSEISNITRSEKNWKDVLKVAGQLYRYEFDNIVMVTAQRSPEKSTLMADYDTWKKVGRYVKRGAKGCAIFPSRALNPRMRYIFDISDTGGKNVKLTWDLEGDMLEAMTYKEVDGLLYPELTMPDETEDLTKLGRYGRMAMKYLLENEPARYKTLMRFGKMYEKMSAVEEEANQLYDQLEEQYLMKHKPQNPSSTMEMWKIREQAKMQAEEVVLHQIVMKFH